LLLLRKDFYKTTKNKFIYSLVGIAVQICAGRFLKMIKAERELIIKDQMSLLKKVIKILIISKFIGIFSYYCKSIKNIEKHLVRSQKSKVRVCSLILTF